MISSTIEIGQDYSDSAGLHGEVAATRSELHGTKVTLTRSISETIAAADYLREKCDRFENQTEERFTFINSKLGKLSRTQVRQVSAFPIPNVRFTYFPKGSED
jgi:hypothetical protein